MKQLKEVTDIATRAKELSIFLKLWYFSVYFGTTVLKITRDIFVCASKLDFRRLFINPKNAPSRPKESPNSRKHDDGTVGNAINNSVNDVTNVVDKSVENITGAGKQIVGGIEETTGKMLSKLHVLKPPRLINDGIVGNTINNSVNDVTNVVDKSVGNITGAGKQIVGGMEEATGKMLSKLHVLKPPRLI